MTSYETASAGAADGTPNGRPVDERLSHFRPLQLRKAADVIADVLVDAIRNGLFHPGDRLPRERDLAAQLEVSRTTLREGISILQRARVLNVRRGNGGGVFVATRVIPATLLATAHTLGRYAEVRSLLEVRRPLELLSATLAARRASEEALSELSNLIDQLEPLVESDEEFMHLDFQIHLRIAEASQNPILVAFLDDLLKKQAAIRFEYAVVTFSPMDALRLHRRMLRAIEARDEIGVFAAVDEHLARVEEHMLGERLALAEPPDLGRSVL
jgi:GntR family transcriptional repressor for pyruvate dehydrogenase complex